MKLQLWASASGAYPGDLWAAFPVAGILLEMGNLRASRLRQATHLFAPNSRAAPDTRGSEELPREMARIIEGEGVQ